MGFMKPTLRVHILVCGNPDLCVAIQTWHGSVNQGGAMAVRIRLKARLGALAPERTCLFTFVIYSEIVYPSQVQLASYTAAGSM